MTKKYYEAHKEEQKQKMLEYYQKNKKKFSKESVEYRKTHKKEIKERQKKYRLNHKEQRKQYLLTNKKRICELHAKWEVLHRKERRQYQLNLIKNRRKNDVNFKILCNLRLRLWEVMKNNSKSDSIKILLGCSVKQLKVYLESKFTPGMTWETYGLYGWHIDHIKPCAKFDLSKPLEQHKCFHYTNLQPLWAKDNLSKSDKF